MAINVSNKKPNVKNQRSHALNATKKQQKPNLQVVRLEDGSKVRVSAREKRTLEKMEQQGNSKVTKIVDANTSVNEEIKDAA